MNKTIIEPEEMPKFLNELAEKFKDEEGQETMLKLAQCSVYIHAVNQLVIQKKSKWKGKFRMSSYENGKRTRLGRIWNNMKKRCNNERHESYKYYGAKGIKVCEEWANDVDAFISWATNNGYSDDLTIDRIDNNKGYSPDNCR